MHPAACPDCHGEGVIACEGEPGDRWTAECVTCGGTWLRDDDAAPAVLLQTLASDALRARGESASAAAVARLLGETPSAWTRYVRGEVAPSSERVARWVATLGGAGIEARLTVDADGWATGSAPAAPSLR